VIPEPEIREDGRCVVCETPITTITRYGEADAFCKSRCAREYFGTQLAVDVDSQNSVLSQTIRARHAEGKWRG
jgi:hypothetical protein